MCMYIACIYIEVLITFLIFKLDRRIFLYGVLNEDQNFNINTALRIIH